MNHRRKLLILSLLLILLTCQGRTTSSNKRQRSTANNSNNPNSKKEDDYYGILGISKSSKPKQIKSAYRKLALKYHPDKVKANSEAEKQEAEQLFMKVNEAYAVLSDEEKKKVYDKHGKKGLEALEKGMNPDDVYGGFGGFDGFHPGGGGGGGSSHSFHFNGGAGGGGGAGFDPFDIFNQFFQQESGSSHNGRGRAGADPFGFGGGFGGFDMGAGGHRQQQRQVKELFPVKDSPVSRLGKSKFPDSNSKHLWLVTFYSNQSEECIQMEPHVKKLSTSLKGNVKVGAINCDNEQAFCRKQGVKSYPTFAFVLDGKLDFYEGELSTRGLHEFSMSKVPYSLIHNINHSQHVQERLLQHKKPAILLLTDKYETSSLYVSLAYEFRKYLIFGESRAKNLSLAKEFGVKKYPLLLALFPGRYQEKPRIVRYDGAIKGGEISKWINQVLKDSNK